MTATVRPRLFSDDGWVHPSARRRYFVDQTTGEVRVVQDARFDGGWRWFCSDLDDVMTIYNKLAHPRAHWLITHTDLEETRSPELLLQATQVHVMIEDAYYRARQEVLAYIPQLALMARRGESW